MRADYVANPLYDNNPFIEALPPMLSGKDLIRALAVIPPYSDSDRDRSTGERLQLLSSLYEFYQPLSMTIDLYCEIYTAMQHCYGQYSVQSEAAAFQNGYSLMHGNALAASIGGGNSFSVVGVSGLGKSTALQRVLSLYPQVIEHTEYHGQKFYCHQIPYLVVQTPHDASIKALILDIYLQIDSLIGTCYQKDALSRRLSIDVLVSQLNQIVRVNHIGLLVIDELQNIAYRKSDGGMRFLNFLVHLINGAGVSVCMVGTPRVLQVLQQEFRAARRTTGLVYDRLPNDKEFSLLLHTLGVVLGAQNSDSNQFAQEYALYGSLKKVANAHSIALLVIHHLRKTGDDNNPFNRIYGGVATQAALDTMMVLEKDTHASDSAHLHVSGRRCPQQDFVLSFDADTCIWSMVGNSAEADEKFHRNQYERSEAVVTIKEAVASGNGSWSGSMSDLSRMAETIPCIGHGLGHPRSLSNEVNHFKNDLCRYDGITITIAKNGTGGRKYTFSKATH